MNWIRKGVAAVLATCFVILAIQNLRLEGERHRAALLEQEMAVEQKRFNELRHRFQRVRKHFDLPAPVEPDQPKPHLNRAA